MEIPERLPTDADTARELANVEAEPLLPAEKWLIGGSLVAGISLLGLFLWLSHRYYPVGP